MLTKPPLILTTGLKRSGSTWLYNATRLILENLVEESVASGWIDDMGELGQLTQGVVKLHDPNELLRDRADFVFHSHRDLRDIAASLQRKFGIQAKLATVAAVVEDDLFWSACADLTVSYEQIVGQPEVIVGKLYNCLGVVPTAAQIDEVVNTLAALQSPSEQDEARYDPVTLLHKQHVTHGGQGSWQGELSEELVEEITVTFGDWLSAKGYKT